MSSNGIAFNCKRKQITIKIREYVEFKDVVKTLKKQMREIRILYKNSEPKLIEVIGRDFKKSEQKYIKKILSKFFISQVEFISDENLGLSGIQKSFKREIATSETTFYRHSLRSGQKIEFNGSIVVLGDVNRGAEVIAGENIVVLGTLRGLAHAGAKGNKEAIICAGAIDVSQIRISDIVRECEKDEFEGMIKTNVYIDENDKIIIE
ncbi:MAG: septum site-determining protein MinC [Clostridia bacterium]|nr:septum site-determining protein MinC [Clostridia bacterium]